MKSFFNRTLTVGLVTATLAIGTNAMAQNSGSTPPQPNSPSVTQKRDNVIEGREKEQQQRIEQGITSGELTRGEAKNLENKEVKVKKMEEKAELNGKISKKEVSQDIHKKKHNKRKKKVS